MYFNNDLKVAGAATGGAVVGALQTILLRQYVDDAMATNFLKNTSGSPPFLMKQLKGFGSPSALFGMLFGAVGLFSGLAVMLKGMITRSTTVGAGLLGYGSTALITGALSGVFPTSPWQAAVSTDPNNPIGAPSISRKTAISQSGIQRAVLPPLEA
jgi:hypothetical protein